MTALRRAAFQAVREPQGAGRRDLANVQFHHRMNLPNGVARHVLATVALIFPSDLVATPKHCEGGSRIMLKFNKLRYNSTRGPAQLLS